MFKILVALFLIIASAYGDEKLTLDLDGDNVADSLYLDSNSSKIICKLSTQNFQKIESKFVDSESSSWLEGTKGGFVYHQSFMRAGYACQFRYDKKIEKIQLIGMSRYEFGNAANDGSGESSVNLLTDDYIGNWHYYDHEKDKLMAIPPIKTKMHFEKIYLESFSSDTYFDYGTRCAELCHKYKEIDIKQHRR
jgi:hypothetical protein